MFCPPPSDITFVCFQDHVCTFHPLLLRLSQVKKTCSKARGIMPQVSLSLRFPSIVNVFPEPVWPYAKIHTLYPSSTLWTNWEISVNTVSCVDTGGKTLSNVNGSLLAWRFVPLTDYIEKIHFKNKLVYLCTSKRIDKKQCFRNNVSWSAHG